MTDLRDGAPSEDAVVSLRQLANEIDATIAHTRAQMPAYGSSDKATVPYIIDFQLDRNNVGYEARLLHRCADEIERLRARISQ